MKKIIFMVNFTKLVERAIGDSWAKNDTVKKMLWKLILIASVCCLYIHRRNWYKDMSEQKWSETLRVAKNGTAINFSGCS